MLPAMGCQNDRPNTYPDGSCDFPFALGLSERKLLSRIK